MVDVSQVHFQASDIVPTVMRAGEWSVTYPASCTITSAVLFPPALADAESRDDFVMLFVGPTPAAKRSSRSKDFTNPRVASGIKNGVVISPFFVDIFPIRKFSPPASPREALRAGFFETISNIYPSLRLYN